MNCPIADVCPIFETSDFFFFGGGGGYGQSRLFHSFLAVSVVRWGENGRSPRIQNTWPPASRSWLVSHVTRARLEPTAVTCNQIYILIYVKVLDREQLFSLLGLGKYHRFTLMYALSLRFPGIQTHGSSDSLFRLAHGRPHIRVEFAKKRRFPKWTVGYLHRHFSFRRFNLRYRKQMESWNFGKLWVTECFLFLNLVYFEYNWSCCENIRHLIDVFTLVSYKWKIHHSGFVTRSIDDETGISNFLLLQENLIKIPSWQYSLK